MTAPFLTIADPPMEQTIRVAREALGAVLAWQPVRWVADVPADREDVTA